MLSQDLTPFLTMTPFLTISYNYLNNKKKYRKYNQYNLRLNQILKANTAVRWSHSLDPKEGPADRFGETINAERGTPTHFNTSRTQRLAASLITADFIDL